MKEIRKEREVTRKERKRDNPKVKNHRDFSFFQCSQLLPKLVGLGN